MKHEILYGPSAALLRVELGAGETVTAESGAMVSRSSCVGMKTRMNSSRKAGFFAKLWSVLVAFFRKLAGGESFFVNDFLADAAGEVTFAPTLSGAIHHRRLQGEHLIVQPGSFLASTGDVDARVKWGGLKSIFAKEGAFLLDVSGSGDLFFNSYGGIQEISLNGTYVVDTGHMVAFEPSLNYRIRAAGGGLMGLVASGEGLICEFSGQGKVWIQSRNLSALVGWITPRLS